MLYRTSITPPVLGLRREIDRLFEDAFTGDGGRGWTPVADVREDAQALTFELEIPGIDPENVEVTCDNGVLSITGEKSGKREENEEGRYHIVERMYGRFSKSYQLPQNVNEDAIEAEFENGVLSIRVPKAEQPKPKRIQVAGKRGSQQISSGSAGTSKQEAKDRPEQRIESQAGSEQGKGSTSGSEKREKAGAGAGR